MNNSQVTLGLIEVFESFLLGGVVYTRQPKGHRDTNFGTVPVVSTEGKQLAFDSTVQVRRLSAHS
jgi:outer membrane scaffolding protein for murein synthesis (MipA/OmpV family)